jgi:hypothetical protein
MGLMLAFLGFLFFDGLLLCSAYNVHHYSFIVSVHNDVHVICLLLRRSCRMFKFGYTCLCVWGGVLDNILSLFVLHDCS